MALDDRLCYDALLSRDRRFDGRFFTGVTTTGVYCRPICPAPPPRRKNVRFYVCAAAAEAAGFRPCLRCRPETAPGTPAWMGTSAVVQRALRLIGDGALDEGCVAALADRLGLGERQLRRHFERHLGASPVDIARARRVHFAKRLIDDTVLPITTIAFASGFGSLRQFNHDMKATFRRAPRELRRDGAVTRDTMRTRGGVTVALAYRPPLEWDGLVTFLSRRAIPGVEVVTGKKYARTIVTNGTVGTIEAWKDDRRPVVYLRIFQSEPDGLVGIAERARRMFDLGADPLAIVRHLRGSSTLERIVDRRPGMRLPTSWDPFETAVRAIVGQQISVKGATTIMGRLVSRLGRPVDGLMPGLTHLFPLPSALVAADLSQLGLPIARQNTIRSLATAIAEGRVALDGRLPLETLVERLEALPGIGPWSAHYIAMRGVGEPDAFPAGDLGLRKAVQPGVVLSARALETLAEPWRPWRAYAAMHLWSSLSTQNERNDDDVE